MSSSASGGSASVTSAGRDARALVIGVRDFAHQRVDVVTVASGRAPAGGEALTDVQDARTSRLDARAGEAVRALARDGSVRRLLVTASP